MRARIRTALLAPALCAVGSTVSAHGDVRVPVDEWGDYTDEAARCHRIISEAAFLCAAASVYRGRDVLCGWAATRCPDAAAPSQAGVQNLTNHH